MGAFPDQTIPQLLAGRDVPASDWLVYYNFVSAGASAWVDFSASLTVTSQTSTDPTKGASTYEARYRQLGKHFDYVFRVTIGAGFAAGSGAYRFLLPASAVDKGVGHAWVNDSGTGKVVGICRTYSASNPYVEIWLANSGSAPLGSAGPGTAWAAGDVIEAQISYESL